MSLSFFRRFFYSQLFVTPPYPTQDFEGKTVIVTGSNVGLGFEAARHFARLNCTRLILAVRTISKGERAKESILETTQRKEDFIEVWPLDLNSTESVKAFTERAKSLDRIDVLVESAGINNHAFHVSEGYEQTIKVNLLSTLQLALLLLPKLRETALKFQTIPHLEIVGSEAHRLADYDKVDTTDIYAALLGAENFDLRRYSLSKVMQILFIRELVGHMNSIPVITVVNPGFCYSDIFRLDNKVILMIYLTMRLLLARTTEVGARTLIAGACAGPESHGKYISDSIDEEVEPWILTSDGARIQKAVYDQTLAVLEKLEPGISKNI